MVIKKLDIIFTYLSLNIYFLNLDVPGMAMETFILYIWESILAQYKKIHFHVMYNREKLKTM